MAFLRSLIHYLASPVFFVLAALFYLNPQADHTAMMRVMGQHMTMMGMTMPDETFRVGSYDLGPTLSTVLGGMGLMYLLMGVFHLGPWLRMGLKEKTALTRRDVGSY